MHAQHAGLCTKSPLFMQVLEQLEASDLAPARVWLAVMFLKSVYTTLKPEYFDVCYQVRLP